MRKIALIAPYAGLLEVARSTVARFEAECPPYVVETHQALLERGVELARNLEREGCEAIVSRGRTAAMIREQAGIPVVDITISSYDLVRALARASQLGRRIALIVFHNMVQSAADVAALMGIDLSEFIVRDEEAAAQALSKALRRGAEVIVGGSLAVRLARGKGVASVLIESGPEAIWQALQEAHRMVELRLRERARAEQLCAILDEVPHAIVVTDSAGTITGMNAGARKILGERAAIGGSLTDVWPEASSLLQEESGDMVVLCSDGGKVVCRAKRTGPGPDGGVLITCQEVGALQHLERAVRVRLNQRGHVARHTLDDVVGVSAALTRALATARKFAPADATVLITGESGTGKELFAQGIHNASLRRQGPFVAVNCAAFAESLLESELFGYARGAFTGARKEGKAGLFELAHGGTLFLDEVTEMSPAVQAKVLRVLEEREVMRLGDERMIPVNVRIIAATNRDIEEAVRRGHFRVDLYHRLDVLRIAVPPLRQRKEDIPLLFEHFARLFALQYGKPMPKLGREALVALLAYEWPGNVRELQNVVARLVLLSPDREVTVDDLVAVVPPLANSMGSRPGPAGAAKNVPEDLAGVLAALEAEGFNTTRAASRLGIHRTTLWRRLRKYGVAIRPGMPPSMRP
jgi:transcriptional regulator with PAS, ATPase and Fis domain